MTIESYLINLKQNGFSPKNMLDIGAHFGEFSNLFHSIWPSTEILMIEGNQECETFLDALPFDHCIALLSDENKEVTLHLNPNNLQCTGTSYYKENTKHYIDSVEVQRKTFRLDEITDEVRKKFEIIKIDTQGSELDIIRGGSETIKYASYVILEVSMVEYNSGCPLFDEVVSYMNNIGFDSYEIVEEHIWNDSDYKIFSRGQLIQVDIVFKNGGLM